MVALATQRPGRRCRVGGMPDVQVLYIVTTVVLGALLLWVGSVLLFARTAPDESGLQPTDEPPPAKAPAKAAQPIPPPPPPPRDETPPPAVVDVPVSKRLEPVPSSQKVPPPEPPPSAPAPTQKAIAAAGAAAPVVILPVMRHRLDSHRGIKDGTPMPPIVLGAPGDEASGPPLSLVSAVARPVSPVETSVIVDAHRLFIVADGSGRRVQHNLASSLVVDALVAAFSVDTDDVFPADTSLAPRADRLRRSVLVAQTTLKGRTDSEPQIVTAPMRLLAAHFAPDNRRLFVASVGQNRAYRLRGGTLLRLNKESASTDPQPPLDSVVTDTMVDDVFVFGSEAAFLPLGDRLQAVLSAGTSVERVAAQLVEAATKGGSPSGLSPIVVRVARSPLTTKA